MELTADNVKQVATDSMFSEGEIDGPEDAEERGVLVEGITADFVFDPDALEEHREEVVEFLEQLDDRFKEEEGGGWSFLNLPSNEEGDQWGGQRDAETLAALAIGLGLASWVPKQRKVWSALPGGVPYFSYTT